ncbi:DNA primase [Pantoea agglomerans pv. betae]|uniref:hypothetical protein n=1 Tax=Enterobacter agglomerans TaxID=549 RepID=UPI0007E56E40|nr:hypothetical protein [Pantoea agglomerans]WHU82985.1 DNA primase [Pantoea agglomerans pv. betae]
MPKMSRFAHLLGRRALADESDEHDETEEEEEKGKKGQKAKGRKAEEEKDDPDADDDEDDEPDADDDSDDPDAEEDDDDKGAEDGDDDDDNKAVKKGRRAERNRCARIFGSKYASGNTALAATLAFDTGMSSKQAIRVMASSGVQARATGVSTRVTLDQRMSNVKNHHLGEDNKPANTSTPKGAASAMAALYNRVRGVKK